MTDYISREAVLREMQAAIDAVPPGYTAGSAKAELAIAMQRIAALPVSEDKDGERYRWLRDHPWDERIQAVIELHKNALWDATIDAAMQEGKP